MATVSVGSTILGNGLETLLMCDDIEPGSSASYQVCKEIYSYHPLGKKMVDKPLTKAQSLPREITVQNANAPEERLVEAFNKEWEQVSADRHILNFGRLARIYGIATLGTIVEGENAGEPLDFESLAKKSLSFSEWDPLNTAGSLVLNQNPNAPDYQKHDGVTVSGERYHRSRVVVLMNEDPIYIEYTGSAFGFVGRSVYQRALFPLKSFINTMRTDDMVSRKAGVLVAKMAQPGSIIDNAMQFLFGQKRDLLKEAMNNNVLGIGPEDSIESLNLQNLDSASSKAREHIIENIASAADMPAKLLTSESYAEGFGEGSEDAKEVVEYINGIRGWLKPAYEFFDQIVMRRAWNEDFFNALKEEFPESYAEYDYTRAFYEWKNAFKAKWPSLLIEPESEQAKKEQIKFDVIIKTVEVLHPILDPMNRVNLIQFIADNLSEQKTFFTSPLTIDYKALENYTPPAEEQEEETEEAEKPAHEPRVAA
jgi:hypothetical protein